MKQSREYRNIHKPEPAGPWFDPKMAHHMYLIVIEGYNMKYIIGLLIICFLMIVIGLWLLIQNPVGSKRRIEDDRLQEKFMKEFKEQQEIYKTMRY